MKRFHNKKALQASQYKAPFSWIIAHLQCSVTGAYSNSTKMIWKGQLGIKESCFSFIHYLLIRKVISLLIDRKKACPFPLMFVRIFIIEWNFILLCIYFFIFILRKVKKNYRLSSITRLFYIRVFPLSSFLFQLASELSIFIVAAILCESIFCWKNKTRFKLPRENFWLTGTQL